MNKRKIFLGILLAVIFLGGFLVGAFFSKEEKQQLNIVKMEKLPHSDKSLQAKEIPKIKERQSNVLIGYVQDFRDPDEIDYSKLTHVVFSFAHPEKDGSLLFTGDYALENLRKMVAKGKSHNTKVLLAIGGWFHMNGGESYDYFSAAISKSTSRTKLVNELVKVVDSEYLDGIDIDFEHPRTDADAKNLTAFIKELGSKLHPDGKELSIAVHSKIHGLTLTELGYVKYEPEMFQSVDYVNIMAYDGQWDGGYHASNLSPYPFTQKIVSYWSDIFEKNKIAREKLILGVPFYAQPEDPKSKQVSYEAIVNANPANATSDTVSMNGTTYYYNGKTMMKKKTQLALDHGFGGMMIWELGLDSEGENSLTSTLYDALSAPSNLTRYYSHKK